jgi:antirestriction protein
MEISPYADVIDSRDVQERIEALESDAEEYGADSLTLTEVAELDALRALRDMAMDYTSEWYDGTTLVRLSYWMDYAQEYMEDTTDIPDHLASYIDYEAFASDLAVDYTEIDFVDWEYNQGSITYRIR